MKRILSSILMTFMVVADLSAQPISSNSALRDQLYQSFLTPPDSIRVGCYYYWVNERVDPKGVKADLQWMKDNGITYGSAADVKPLVQYLCRCNFMLQLGKPYNNATDQRIMDDGTIIRFTDDSQFEVTFPDGRKEKWNPIKPI